MKHTCHEQTPGDHISTFLAPLLRTGHSASQQHTPVLFFFTWPKHVNRVTVIN